MLNTPNMDHLYLTSTDELGGMMIAINRNVLLQSRTVTDERSHERCLGNSRIVPNRSFYPHPARSQTPALNAKPAMLNSRH